MGFYIMPKYDMSLSKYLDHFQGQNRLQKVVEVSIQLLDILQHIHSVRRTHNDLKPENVMINLNGHIEKTPTVVLIDPGFTQKLSQHSYDLTTFEGNMLFSSLNQMDFKSTSQRDDLVSLFYLMVFLINDDQFVNSSPAMNDGNMDITSQFKGVMEYK